MTDLTPEVREYLAGHTMDQIESDALHEHLKANDLELEKTRQTLGKHINTVRNWIEKYGFSPTLHPKNVDSDNRHQS